jgi:hypothetical protein
VGADARRHQLRRRLASSFTAKDVRRSGTAYTGAYTGRCPPTICRDVRNLAGPFAAAWLSGIRMVERVMCAAVAANAHLVQTSVQTSG